MNGTWKKERTSATWNSALKGLQLLHVYLPQKNEKKSGCLLVQSYECSIALHYLKYDATHIWDTFSRFLTRQFASRTGDIFLQNLLLKTSRAHTVKYNHGRKRSSTGTNKGNMRIREKTVGRGNRFLERHVSEEEKLSVITSVKAVATCTAVNGGGFTAIVPRNTCTASAHRKGNLLHIP